MVHVISHVQPGKADMPMNLNTSILSNLCKSCINAGQGTMDNVHCLTGQRGGRGGLRDRDSVAIVHGLSEH